MIDIAPRNFEPRNQSIGVQPIMIGAVVLVLVLLGIGGIAGWRAYTGNWPESERAAISRQLQARATQASETLIERTKGIEATQQESIDQLQMVQDQLQSVRRLIGSQQADTKKLSEQVAALTEAIEGLRQSYASAQAAEPSEPSARRSSRKSHGRSAHRRRGRSQG